MGQSNNQGTTVFVLGLLSLILCQILGPVAWMMGNTYVQQCAMDGVTPDGLGVAGRVMGMIGTALFVLNIVVVLAVFGLYCCGFGMIFAGAGAAGSGF